jgi:hypothetical protein
MTLLLWKVVKWTNSAACRFSRLSVTGMPETLSKTIEQQ